MMGRRLRASSGKPVNPDLPPISEGLVGYWPLDDELGDFARDASGNGNDAQFAGTVDPIWSTLAGEKCLYASEDGWLEVAPSAVLDNLPQVTMTARVAAAFRYSAFMVNDCVGTCYPRVWLGTNNSDLEVYVFEGTVAKGLPSFFEVPSSSWLGCAGTVAGGAGVLDFQAVAGSQNTSSQVAASSVNAATAGWTFGGSRSSNPSSHQARPFSGFLRDLRVYNRVLTVQECIDINSGVG